MDILFTVQQEETNTSFSVSTEDSQNIGFGIDEENISFTVEGDPELGFSLQMEEEILINMTSEYPEKDPIFTASPAFSITNQYIQDWIDAYNKSHTHPNKSLIDSLINSGSGNKFLADDGQYKEVAGGGGNMTPVYFTTIDSDVTGYKKISYTPEVTETTLTSTLNNQELLLRTYLYDDGIDVPIIPGGTWTASYRTKVSGTQGVTQLKFETFLRHLDGSETTLFSDYSDEINNTDFQTLKKETTQPLFNCLPTDRFGVRIYGKVTASNTITISTAVGDGNASYFTTTLAQRHNTLRDLDFEHSGHKGFVGTKSWISLKDGWSQKPTKYQSFDGYSVWLYTYGSTQLYRKVPKPYNPSQDAFYTDDTLTTVVSTRALSLT